jgi:hypothetical protein
MSGEHVVELLTRWGGSTQFDRYRAQDLPIAESVEARPRMQSGEPRRSKRDKRIAVMFGVGRFHLGGVPGPGRGHRGPIATYAAAHGCSMDTAWRRLRRES